MFFNAFKKDKKSVVKKETESDSNGKEVVIGQKSSNSVSGTDFLRMYAEQYAPYTLKDHVIKERSYDEIPLIDEKHPQLQSVAHRIESMRSQDPMIGAKMASQEIYMNITNMLKDDKGVHAETLLAALASIGGRACVQGVMNTLENMVSADSPDKKKLIYSLATILSIYICETKSGDAYILGDRIGNEFTIFYKNALAGKGDVQDLVPISRKTAELAGSEERYWETPFDEIIKLSPQKFADSFNNVFEITFKTYCRFPQERMLAVAFAAQKAVRELTDNHIMELEKAASIIAEYGWRTSHYWGKL